MISARLLSIVRCADCHGTLTDLSCGGCGRRYPAPTDGFLDLQPSTAFADTTKYLDEALHADARHETVSPPLLSAAIRNDMLRAFLSPDAGDRVVELGCGSGRALVWNRGWGAYLVGVDAGAHFAAEARETVDLIVADLRRLPLADGAFTKGFSLDVLEHVPRPGLADVLREAARILVPGGTLFVYTHVRRNSSLALGLRAINRLAAALERVGLIDLRQERLRKSDHLNPLADIADFERIAAEAGFRVTRIRYYTPLVGGLVETLLAGIATRWIARRASRRGDAEPLRTARRAAKRRIARRGPTYWGLRTLTCVMKLDVMLFGRIPSGPFFALLRKEDGGPRAEA